MDEHAGTQRSKRQAHGFVRTPLVFVLRDVGKRSETELSGLILSGGLGRRAASCRFQLGKEVDDDGEPPDDLECVGIGKGYWQASD